MVLAEIQEGMSSSLGQNIQPTFGYYRQPNGWITVSPNTRLERSKYIEEGWQYLEQYGSFDMTAYGVNHPLEGLFMFGGAKELPIDQVLATGLYIDPPLVPRCRQHLTQYHRAHKQDCWRDAKPVDFPQMSDVAANLIGPFVCEFCNRKMPTQQALTQHQGVAHRVPLNNIQLGRTMGDSLASALGKPKVAEDNEPGKEALLQRIAELEAEQAKTEKNRATMAKARAGRKPKPAVKTG